MSAAEKPVAPRTRRKDARPAEISAAALGVFHAKGFAAAKIEDIAHAAGVATGTVYLYFRNKQDLFKAAVRELVIPNLDRIEAAAMAEPSCEARLRVALSLWAEGVQNSRGCISKLVIAEAGNFPDLVEFYRAEVSDRVMNMLVRILEAGVSCGELRTCDTKVVARMLAAPLVINSIWRHTFPAAVEQGPGIVTQMGLVLDVVMHGLVNSTKVAQ